MKERDRDCQRLADIQAELFELSVKKLEMSSEVFVRRYMNSKIVKELDDYSFLDDSKSIEDIFIELDNQYGKTNYGTIKYNHDAMYWAGYLYRCFAYTYEVSSKQAYKMLPLKEVISLYEPYHTLDISHAIERMLEAKNISFNYEDNLRRGVEILKKIRKQNMIDSILKEDDLNLLCNDKYTFFVLGKVMNGDCKMIYTDHKNFIICYVDDIHPIWIWTKNNLNKNYKDIIYNILKENNLLNGNHSFNVKYELYEYFKISLIKDNINVSILINMYAYDCEIPIKPTECDGNIHKCDLSDLDELSNIIYEFHESIGIDKKKKEDYTLYAKKFIEDGYTYLWKDKDNNIVASSKYSPNGDLASINLVYTKEQYRRKHYAANLVYEVTKIVLEKGYIPMLYTNADYKASNACYEKIGYKLKGKLCTIKVE